MPLPALITTEAEQTFLAHHFETLSKDPTRDPRQQFRQPIGSAADGSSGTESFGAGVVGPMGGSSSLSLPSVKAAMADSDADDVGTRILKAAGGPAPRRVCLRSWFLYESLILIRTSGYLSAGPSISTTKRGAKYHCSIIIRIDSGWSPCTFRISWCWCTFSFSRWSWRRTVATRCFARFLPEPSYQQDRRCSCLSCDRWLSYARGKY